MGLPSRHPRAYRHTPLRAEFVLGFTVRSLHCNSSKFARLAQIFRIVRTLDSDIPLAKTQRRQVLICCHFDPWEKSFLDPSHSLGMTGIGPSPLRLCTFARDIPKFDCGFAVLGSLRPFIFSVADIAPGFFGLSTFSNYCCKRRMVGIATATTNAMPPTIRPPKATAIGAPANSAMAPAIKPPMGMSSQANP